MAVGIQWYHLNIVWDKLDHKLEERNLKPVKYPPMAPETRASLADHFRPGNEKLSALLGRDLSHWR